MTARQAEHAARYQRSDKGRAAKARFYGKRRRYLAERNGTACWRCGGTFMLADLHFHHRDPSTKLFNVGHGVGRARAVLDAEIAKCDVLCQPCHTKAHEEISA